MNHGNPSRAPVTAVVAIAAALCVGSCGRPDAPRGSGDSRDGTDTLALEPVTAAQLHDRVLEPGARATLVNVWATWCAPCRDEFPTLVRLAERERARGLRVLFVSADFAEEASPVRAFLAEQHAPGPWLVKAGPDMEFINGLDARWSGALPVTIVYDPSGNPVEFWEGGADSARFATAVAPLLASPTH